MAYPSGKVVAGFSGKARVTHQTEKEKHLSLTREAPWHSSWESVPFFESHFFLVTYGN
jgi:hypothetical protein